MFSTKHEEESNHHAVNHSGAETIIGPSVKVDGTFQGEGDVLVEGMVTGMLTTAKDLTVGEHAKIEADVKAANMYIAGEVRGNLQASGTIELAASAKIYGDMEAEILSIASGAVVQGRCVSGKSGSVVVGEAQKTTMPSFASMERGERENSTKATKK